MGILKNIGTLSRHKVKSVRRFARGSVTRIRRRSRLRGVDTLRALRKRRPDFDSTRDQICRSGTDSLAHFGNGYTHEGDLFLQQNPDEFAALCLFLKEKTLRHNYVEIGSASGGACLFLYQQIGFDHVLSLDDGQHPRATEQQKHFGKIENFKQFVGDSHSVDAIHFLKHHLNGEIDIAFIDGDHSYQGVSQDIELVLPFCKKGTLLIFHDTIACAAVEKAWLQAVEKKVIHPLAEYISQENPLGIAVGSVL